MGSAYSIEVDTSAAVDIQSIASDDITFSPLDFTVPSIQSALQIDQTDRIILFFEPQADEKVSQGEVSSCSYVMVA